MRKPRLLLSAAFAIAGPMVLIACGGPSGVNATAPANSTAHMKDSHATSPQFTVLDQAFPKPDLTLTDQRGQPYDLRKETAGKPTLLYFGYTHCPDVCPLTVSNLGVAKKSLTKAEQMALQVVFITTDPERDTPAELAKWLPAAGDPSFVGLTGDFNTIQAAARSVAISIEPPVKEKDGSITSTHGAQVIAFSPKTNQGSLLYQENAPSEVYTRTLPGLIDGQNRS